EPRTASTRPLEQAIERPRVDDAVARHAGVTGVRDRRFRVLELADRVGVAVEGEEASAVDRRGRKLEIDILPGRIAVDLDRDAAAGRGREHLRPLSRDPGPRPEHAADRNAECGEATTISSVASSPGSMSTRPSDRMFASIPFNIRKRPS